MIKRAAASFILLPVLTVSLLACNHQKDSSGDPAALLPKSKSASPQESRINPSAKDASKGASKDAAKDKGSPDSLNEASAPPAEKPAAPEGNSSGLEATDSDPLPKVLAEPLAPMTESSPRPDANKSPAPEKQITKEKDSSTDGPRIEVLNKELLTKIDSKDVLVLFQNSLQTKTRALDVLLDRGQGIFCQTSQAEQIQSKEVLEMVDGDVKTADNDKTVEITKFVYKSKKSGSLHLICTTRGKVSSQEYHDNFKDVLTFLDDSPTTTAAKPDGRTRETPEEIAANNLKMKSFRISDPETFSKIIVPANQWNDSLSLMAGKLVKAIDAQNQITEGHAEEACQIAYLQGQLLKGKVYSLADRSVVGADQTRRTALLSYTYASDEKNTVTLYCFVRMSAPAIEIFNVFKNVLEFGPAPSPSTQPRNK